MRPAVDVRSNLQASPAARSRVHHLLKKDAKPDSMGHQKIPEEHGKEFLKKCGGV